MKHFYVTARWLVGGLLAFLTLRRWPGIVIGMISAWASRLPGTPQDPYAQVLVAVALGGALTLLLGVSAELVLLIASFAFSHALTTWLRKIQARLRRLEGRTAL